MVNIISFLKLVRWPNLLIIALVQYLIRFTITEVMLEVPMLNLMQYSLGVLCSISLAGAGYIVNDIFDMDADKRNKPNRMIVGRIFSTRTAWTLYIILNIIAIITGYLVADFSGLNGLWLIPVVAIALLYLYSIDLKKRAVLGNLIVSFLVALPVFFTGVFDVLPADPDINAGMNKVAFITISAYTLFAFYTNFIREIIKDGEDIEGDQAQGYKTLAVLLGRDHLRYVVLSLILVLLIFTGGFNMFSFENGNNLYSSMYILLFVNLPIFYLMWITLNARTKSDFKKASNVTKVIMVTGILTMLIFTLPFIFSS